MGLSAVTYALAKKYTDKTVIGLGGLKGAPCKVKSVVKIDGRSVITLEWKADDGTTETSEVYVNDGISIWISGRTYAVNDIVVEDNTLYICKTANSDTTFDDSKWDVIATGGSGTSIRELTKAEYDALSPSEKMNGTIYFVTDENGGGSSNVSYSTDEQVIGTWIDGKPLYQKTIVQMGQEIKKGDNTEQIYCDFNHSNDIDTIFIESAFAEGYFTTNVGLIRKYNNSIPIYGQNCYNGLEKLNISVNRSTLRDDMAIFIKFNVTSITENLDHYKYYFTIKYTKTTD